MEKPLISNRQGDPTEGKEQSMGPSTILNYPLVVFCISVIVLWGAAWLGSFFRARNLEERPGEDFGLILGATLTLLALIIGFSFSMATNRYDERKLYEENEANAIGTEYVRADLLPTAEAANVKKLLSKYLGNRLAFYTSPVGPQLQQINLETAKLQADLWSAVRVPGVGSTTAVRALILSGMNDVLNSQGYTQAAWWNRIPPAAWVLMVLIAVCSNVLLGYNSRRKSQPITLLILPVLVSIAFMLIADLDSPRGGLIHVSPVDLLSLSASLRGH